MSNLISTEWLAEHINSEVCILDASWHLPSAMRNAQTEFSAVHIQGAQFFDLDLISDDKSTLPHMLPSPEKFAHEVGKLGANNNQKIICYDGAGLFSAARAWWMFKIFGHNNVFVLDGGLKKWLAEGRPTQSGIQSVRARNFTPSFRPHMLKSITQVENEPAQIVDARSPTRFRGEEPEPRPGVKPGHIPGAKNLHYATLLNGDGSLKSQTELSRIFTEAEIALNQPIITSGGSGVTAAILTLALTELRAENHALYDGSWAEWGASQNQIDRQ